MKRLEQDRFHRACHKRRVVEERGVEVARVNCADGPGGRGPADFKFAEGGYRGRTERIEFPVSLELDAPGQLIAEKEALRTAGVALEIGGFEIVDLEPAIGFGEVVIEPDYVVARIRKTRL